MIKNLKNVGGNLAHFCLGLKTEFSCRDTPFSARSKIFVFCSTLFWEDLILVPNQNCAKKVYAGFLPGLEEITSLKRSQFLTASLLRGSSRYFVILDILLKNSAKAKLAVVANFFACFKCDKIIFRPILSILYQSLGLMKLFERKLTLCTLFL